MADIHNDDPPPYSPVGQTDTRADRDQEMDLDVHLASRAEKKRLWWRNAVINGLFIASWFLFATVLSLYNKWMFSPEDFGFPYPLFVTTLHMFVQFGLAALLRTVWPRHFRPERAPGRRDYILKVTPTGITTGLDIGLSNLSLKTITLSFYTMVKSSSLIFVLFFAFLLKLETFSVRLVGVISLIFAGVLLMVATEAHFVLPGFFLVLSASALGGLRWSLTQLLLRSRDMGMDNPAATLFWLAPVMGTSLALISLFVDRWLDVFASRFFEGVGTTLHTCFFLIAPGAVAFCMVLSEFYILRRAGVVPMSIAGIAKEVTTITISAWFFGDELTPLNITGVALTVCGIALYTYHKYRKSLESALPLDAHGNPLAGADADGALALDLETEHGHGHGHVELGETEHLTSDAARMSMSREDDEDDGAAPRLDARAALFSVGEEDDADAEELRSVHAGKVGALRRGSDPVARESFDVERAWDARPHQDGHGHGNGNGNGYGNGYGR